MKIVGRIVIVLVVAAVLSAGIYFALNGVVSSNQITGNFQSGGQRNSSENINFVQASGIENGQGFHQENRNRGGASGWLDVVKNLSIILVVTSGVILIQKLSATQKSSIRTTRNL